MFIIWKCRICLLFARQLWPIQSAVGDFWWRFSLILYSTNGRTGNCHVIEMCSEFSTCGNLFVWRVNKWFNIHINIW